MPPFTADTAARKVRAAEDADGCMQWRFASINDLPIPEPERKFHWLLGRRPDEHPSPSDLGL